MPFALLPTALGACFILVWVFIGGMIFRDNQFATQQEREADAGILQLPSRHRTHSNRAGGRMIRAAS